MGNVTKVQKMANSDGGVSYFAFIPKALVQGTGLEYGDRIEWTVIAGGFRVIKVK